MTSELHNMCLKDFPWQHYTSKVSAIEIQKGRVRMCSIFQVDSFIGIMQLVIPFSVWDLGQHIYIDFFVLLTCFSHLKLHTRIIILKITSCNIIGTISS